MKRPVDLLCSANLSSEKEQDALTVPGKSAPQAAAADAAKPGHGAFIEELADSLVRRNAQARKGQRGGEGARTRNRRALSRALQKLLQE